MATTIVLGLTRLKDFRWEPLVRPMAPELGQSGPPRDRVLAKRERKQQQKLAERKPPAPSPGQRLSGIVRGVTA
jgi:hypothetical protein